MTTGRSKAGHLGSITLLTPAAPGAIAALRVKTADVDATRRVLNLPEIALGDVRLASLQGVDEGLVVRWTDDSFDLMPHGGTAVVRRLLSIAADRGLAVAPAVDAVQHPTSPAQIEAAMLDALARAASPRAIDLLLAQPARWAAGDTQTPTVDDDARHRLIDPPLVAVVGAPNIGKSSLLNALAGRGVAVVADVAGTTRDAVGAMLELDGLAVRWLDVPGVPGTGSGPDAEAFTLAEPLIASADLVIAACDASQPLPQIASFAQAAVLHIGLRADLGKPSDAVDLAVSAHTGEGLDALAGLIRRTLVSDAALIDSSPWRFWLSDPSGSLRGDATEPRS